MVIVIGLIIIMNGDNDGNDGDDNNNQAVTAVMGPKINGLSKQRYNHQSRS